MLTNAKIGIIGGDLRQAALGRRLSESGFEVAVWGLLQGEIGDCVRCADWHSAVEKSEAIILPLPSFQSGKYSINSQITGEAVTLSQLLYAMPKNAILLGGRIDDVVKKSAAHHGIELLDYFESEMMQIRNAIPTAEGAIEIAMRELPITLHGSKVLVCGYGRIGKILSRMLKNLGAKVYVSARKDSDVAYIHVDGNNAVKLFSASFVNIASNVDVIFNTVPTKIIDKTVIENMSRCRLVIDLASGEGGVDFDAAKKKGVKSIHALALPGKVAPETAGEILSDCILAILSEKGVLPKL